MERIKRLFRKSISIIGVGAYIPENSLNSDEVEDRIFAESDYIHSQKWFVYDISGTHTRHFAWADEQASTLAIYASKKALRNAQLDINDIDCIIFGSASQDIIEPATANIVQLGLGSSAPVMDIKNACNSFLSAMQVASSLIQSGQYKNVLVCSWETPSRAIRWNTKDRNEFKDSLAWYNLGDAGVAMILSQKKKGMPTITFTDFYSKWEYYEASTILGWGSRYPRDMEKTYFSSDSQKLWEAFWSEAKNFLYTSLKKYRWRFSSIRYFFPHIVSRYSADIFRNSFPIAHHHVINYNHTHGNMASCSVVYALIRAIEEKRFSRWDRGLIVWLGAWASFWIIGIQF